MASDRRMWVPLLVGALLIIQSVLIVTTIHRESLTFDESNHTYAGYRMWKDADFGLNPEHPPLVKLLATVPVLGEKLWMPPLTGMFFKGEAMMGGAQWLSHNNGPRLIFRMRLATVVLALALSLLVFVAARDWFGETAGLIAMTFAVFDPNLLAHSGLVTTDLGCAMFFLAVVYAFYRYVRRPGWSSMLVAGLTLGLLLATKHSGILAGPVLLLLAGYELLVAQPGTRAKLAVRLAGACAVIGLVSVFVLWSFYGFRFAARPAGLQMVPTLAQYAGDLKPMERKLILGAAHWHLFPESYLYGLVDIRLFAKFFNSFVLGRWYPHGVLWYFPVVILIKSTLGLLAAGALTVFALLTGKLKVRFREGAEDQLARGRALSYVVIAGGVYLAVAIQNGLNIGVRHILPVFAVAIVLASAGLAALAIRGRAWAWVCAIVVLAHVASSLSAFPNSLAYANEAWGGPSHAHLYLSDSNVDWGQQLIQVKQWEDRHPGEECWFAYFARAVEPPSMYGIRCHVLPNGMLEGFPEDAFSLETVPPVIHGTVLISASELSGAAWSIREMNPYARFQNMKPDERIDDGVFVYRGDIPLADASAISAAFLAWSKLDQKQPQQALALAEQAVQAAPKNFFALSALGDAAAAAGQKEEARSAYRKALDAASIVPNERRDDYVKPIEESLNKL